MGRATEFFKNREKSNGNTLNVCVIGKITAYNSSNHTADILPLAKSHYGDIGILTDVPIMLLEGSDISIKFDLKVGDKVLVLFLDYDSDNLVIDGVTYDAETDRTHALDDAIALPFNFNPINSSLTIDSNFEISSEQGQKLRFETNGDITIESPTDIKFKTSSGTASANARLFD